MPLFLFHREIIELTYCRMRGRVPQRNKTRRLNPHRKKPPAKTIPLKIDGLTWGGKGIGRSGGKVVFVARSAPGDEGQVRVTRDTSSYSVGVFEQLETPSPFRVSPGCPSFPDCGGCHWLQVDYGRQVAEKDQLVRSFLREHLHSATLLPITHSDTPLGYRHRGEFHAATAGGDLVLGFFAEGSHMVVPTVECDLFSPRFNRVLAAVRGALRCAPGAGEVRSVVIAASEDESHFVAEVKVSTRVSCDAAAAICAGLRSSGIGGAVVSGPGGTSPALATSGQASICYTLPSSDTGIGKNLILRASLGSFTQSNYQVNRLLVRELLGWLRRSSPGRVLDLYSGVGNFSLPASSCCRELVAVEDSAAASADAGENARDNGISNITHMTGAALPLLQEFSSSGRRFDLVILDPPRGGAPGAAGPIAALAPEMVAYISCNLPTLARDLGAFSAAGYHLEAVRPFDMFPQTCGVETACLLKRGH